MTECDAAIMGSGITELAAAYRIMQQRSDERVPVVGRMGDTVRYAHAERSIA